MKCHEVPTHVISKVKFNKGGIPKHAELPVESNPHSSQVASQATGKDEQSGGQVPAAKEGVMH